MSSVSDSLIQAYEMQQIEHGSAFLGGFDSQVIWRIPIKVWLYNYDNGTGGYSDDEVQVLINALNNRFNGNYNPRSIADFHSRIQFYLDCNITKINNTAKATSIDTINLEEDVPQQFYDNYKLGYLNLHIFINPLCGLNFTKKVVHIPEIQYLIRVLKLIQECTT